MTPDRHCDQGGDLWQVLSLRRLGFAVVDLTGGGLGWLWGLVIRCVRFSIFWPVQYSRV
jgi:hypothetical protein